MLSVIFLVYLKKWVKGANGNFCSFPRIPLAFIFVENYLLYFPGPFNTVIGYLGYTLKHCLARIIGSVKICCLPFGPVRPVPTVEYPWESKFSSSLYIFVGPWHTELGKLFCFDHCSTAGCGPALAWPQGSVVKLIFLWSAFHSVFFPFI